MRCTSFALAALSTIVFFQAFALGAQTTDITLPQLPQLHGKDSFGNETVNVPNALDISKVEISGFHLYMTGQQALGLLSAKTKRPMPQPNSMACIMTRVRPCFSYENGDNRFTPGKKFISRVTFYETNFQMNFEFTEIYPYDPKRPEILMSITYDPIKLVTPADADAFEKQALAKYGPPTVVRVGYGASDGGEWCERVDNSLAGGLSCSGASTLVLTRMGLSIRGDYEIQEREQKLWDSQRKSEVPLF